MAVNVKTLQLLLNQVFIASLLIFKLFIGGFLFELIFLLQTTTEEVEKLLQSTISRGTSIGIAIDKSHFVYKDHARAQ